ncbi:hypothetical protein HSRCO_0748 [Halanaeroarchaeum sp. HSR-CO]|uniref:hypothetical protein n=1 Tax=Halanaeroarchaeum sp. HSR-CO TaxID=2866382 RepID=UPI00217CE456|nr:hypothetical protein [Halanaeroarchaeum sp. HSR-CO]UWG47042.1 hypothetical protein HSRCO_0748 [Halanaeroarchaeum sp. HSR-CO]
MVSRWSLSALVFVGTILVGSSTIGLGLTLLIPIAAVLAVVALLADSAARREDVNPTGYAGSTASLIQAAGVVLGAWAIYAYVENPIELVTSKWWIFPLAVIGLFTYWYVQHRRQVASSSTAINRTQRTANRTVSSWAELITGVGVLFLTAGFAVISGVLDAFAPFAGELSYLGTVFLGYVSLGGEWGGQIAAIVPSFTPVQWVGVTLFLGGTALYIQSQA